MLVLAAALAWARSEAAVRTERQAFSVSPGATVRLDVDVAEIVVERGEGNEVRFETTFQLDSTDAAPTKRLDEVRIEARQDAQTVTLLARRARTNWRFAWSEASEPEISCRVRVPDGSAIEITAVIGNLTVERMKADVRVRFANGNVFLRGLDGAADVRTGEGEVVISRCTGPASVRVQSGGIRLGTIGGFADLRNYGGYIDVMTALAGISAEADRGEIVVGFGPAWSRPSRLFADGGSVEAKFVDGARATIDARASWGRVMNGLAMTIQEGAAGSRRLLGELNGGGPRVELRASGGNVRIAGDAVVIGVAAD